MYAINCGKGNRTSRKGLCKCQSKTFKCEEYKIFSDGNYCQKSVTFILLDLLMMKCISTSIKIYNNSN